MARVILKMANTTEHDVVAARQLARQVSAGLGYEAQDQTRIATAVSEIARNAARYAHGGEVEGLRVQVRAGHLHADREGLLENRQRTNYDANLPGDGLLGLVSQVEQHAYCEAECRAGRAWPKPETPGRHPRKPKCPSCSQRPSSH